MTAEAVPAVHPLDPLTPLELTAIVDTLRAAKRPVRLLGADGFAAYQPLGWSDRCGGYVAKDTCERLRRPGRGPSAQHEKHRLRQRARRPRGRSDRITACPVTAFR